MKTNVHFFEFELEEAKKEHGNDIEALVAAIAKEMPEAPKSEIKFLVEQRVS